MQTPTGTAMKRSWRLWQFLACLPRVCVLLDPRNNHNWIWPSLDIGYSKKHHGEVAANARRVTSELGKRHIRWLIWRGGSIRLVKWGVVEALCDTSSEYPLNRRWSSFPDNWWGKWWIKPNWAKSHGATHGGSIAPVCGSTVWGRSSTPKPNCRRFVGRGYL